jgi:ribulose 1,5-bisphosphate carboxylase large subunit-like protein
VGIDPSLLTGARFVLNIKVPPIPANVAPTVLGGDFEYEESDEKWQYIEVQVSGSHFSKLALLLPIIITRVYIFQVLKKFFIVDITLSQTHTDTYMH